MNDEANAAPVVISIIYPSIDHVAFVVNRHRLQCRVERMTDDGSENQSG
jgi:hypothetical protein